MSSFAICYKYLGLIISVIEWYDCAICLSLTQIVSNVFFPQFEPASRFLLYFSSFAIGYLGRPLGAFIFGLYSDKYSRLRSAYFAFLLMIFGTLCISLLPSYHAIGLAAPIFFVLLRFMQGVAVGGNYGVSVFSVENALPEKKYFVSSIVCVGFIIGFLLGSATNLCVNHYFSQQLLQTIGWRIPLWISFGVSIPILVVFKKMNELYDVLGHEVFLEKVAQKDSNKKSSFKYQCHKKCYEQNDGMNLKNRRNRPHSQLQSVIITIMLLLINLIPFYLFFVFLPNYNTMILSKDKFDVWAMQSVAMLLMIPAIPWFGKLADKYGAINVLKIAAIALVGVSIFAPWSNYGWIIVFAMISSSCLGCLYGLIALIFPKDVRARTSSITVNATGAISGGLTPILCAYLWNHNVKFLGILLAVVGVIGIISLKTLEARDLKL